jgi:uncharacterized membrane protein
MHFAAPLPWWLAACVAVGITAVAVLSYVRPLVPLTRARQITLMALRGLTLTAVVILLCRPVLVLPSAGPTGVVIPILVDASRSMRIADAEGDTRIGKAVSILEQSLLPELAKLGKVELLEFGRLPAGLSPTTAAALRAEGARTNLVEAIAAAGERYRGRRTPGIVVLSDGADTTPPDANPFTALSAVEGRVPVFAVGVGSPEGPPDREVVDVVAGDPRLDRSLVDLHVSVVTHGFGRVPFTLRLLGNGTLLDTRRIEPRADGASVEETFTVSPEPVGPTLYTAEIASPDSRSDGDAEAAGESILENNTRSVLVSPPSRKRRVLVLAGAPGFEHSFLVRTLSQDPGLEIDSIVRKGKNEDNQDTFLVQAGSSRSASLTTGFPATREALFNYDAIVVANLEADFFTRAQLALTADFVSVRGGGLLVLGGRSFESRGLTGTPLEDALPVELNDRRSGAAPGAAAEGGAPNALVLTADGQTHPITRIGLSAEASRKQWASLPALAASAAVGGPRPGATVLAVVTAPDGTVRPVVAVQRYGAGRSMVFTGEASWRWRMLQPSTDRSYEAFWRQALRWLSSEAPDPVALAFSGGAGSGVPFTVDVFARDQAFVPMADAGVEGTITGPDADARPLLFRSTGNGRFTATVVPERTGPHRVHVEARHGGARHGVVDGWLNVGGSDRELADPRLNEALLRRLARESGGRYVRGVDAASLVADLATAVPRPSDPEQRDLWHEPGAFAAVIALLAGEWVSRRRWGLR